MSELDPLNPGKVLKDEREKMGLSLNDIAVATKINPRILKALEDGQKDTLPPRSFVRGFIRSYANYLKLKPDPILEAFEMGDTPSSSTQTVENETAPMKNTRSDVSRLEQSSKFGTIMVAVGIVVLIVLIFGVKSLMDKYANERVVDKPAVEEPLNDESADATPAPEGTGGDATPAGEAAAAAAPVGAEVAPAVADAKTDSKEDVKVEAKSAEADKAATDAKAAEAKAAIDKATADKAAADKVAADKLAAEKKVAADKAAADEKAAAEKKALADKAAADKVAADKAAAEKKAAADKAAADKLAAEKKATEAKLAADKKAAEAKAAADKKAADAKAAADKKAADAKAAAEAKAATPAPASAPASAAAAGAGPTQEVIIEALDEVTITVTADGGGSKKVSLKPESVYTVKAKEVVLEVSDGGLVNIIQNGIDKGNPGSLGKSAKVKYP